MEAYEQNLPVNIAPSVRSGKLTWAWPLVMVVARTILFLAAGLVIVAVMYATGSPDPWADAIPWWPYQVIVANLIVLPLLAHLTRREGMGLGSLIGFRPALLKKDLLLSAALLVPAFVIAMAGLFGLSYLLWGTPPPETMVQPLPLAAAIVAVILLPLTNAAAETTTYMGYAQPRLEALTKGRWGALLIAAAGLSAQHAAFPLVLDGKFLLWRLAAFFPLALFVGLAYMRIRRLMPLVIVHGLIDLQMAVTVLMVSLPQ